MGGCLSTSSQSSCSSRSSGEPISPTCLGVGLCRRKRNRKTFSDHVTTTQHLSSNPNRIFTNGKSRTSCIFTQQGRKGINQDAMIVWEDFMAEDVTLCGVFDGHGPYGHLVARKVRDALPLKLLSFMYSGESKQNGSTTTCCTGNLKSDGGDPEKDGATEDNMDSLWRDTFLKSFKAMDKELRSHPNLDCFCSGSTAVTIVKQGSNLYMGNIGDSRAILGSKDSNDSMVAIQLTIDLKPDLPREAERIKRCKGRVFALQDEPEVPRVWLPFDDAPGLAMARAFGDFCLKEYGVISIPEFSHWTLTERDKFIVLASDGVGTGMSLIGYACTISFGVPRFCNGLRIESWRSVISIIGIFGYDKLGSVKTSTLRANVLNGHMKHEVWDVLSNEEVVEIVSSVPTRSSAARILVDSAAREWKSKYPTSKMDDCAVVCLFLDGKMDSESDYDEQGFSSATLQSNHSGNVLESDDGGQHSEPSLQRNFTVRSSEENDPNKRLPVEAEVNEETVVYEDQNWSGLEEDFVMKKTMQNTRSVERLICIDGDQIYIDEDKKTSDTVELCRVTTGEPLHHLLLGREHETYIIDSMRMKILEQKKSGGTEEIGRRTISTLVEGPIFKSIDGHK
ncbi:hypothetical protein TEA_002324 [Camellia sinensis var. sinensis]|uniref:protein-serine/threonine phosphatase n=1 Tax=Camellia sinensis var. sinensis TaxID=542762 RepID=A0A4S4DRL1_CAMSN|nr:hypothetical protein TEA_002324 [Camellia sinensis var. sinensis]